MDMCYKWKRSSHPFISFFLNTDNNWWPPSNTEWFPPQGVKHLKVLERLILYYNDIPSLEEVTVLFELPALSEIDLRLNPLTKRYPKYRPCLVHAMPNLRKLGKIKPCRPYYANPRWVLTVTNCPLLPARWLFSQRHRAQSCHIAVLLRPSTSAEELVFDSGCWPKVHWLSEASV